MFFLCFGLISLSNTAVQAKVNFIPINETPDGVLSFSGFDKSWDDPLQSMRQDIDNLAKQAEDKRGQRFTNKERRDFEKRAIEFMSTSKVRSMTVTLATNPNIVVYRLGINIPDNVKISLKGVGALRFTLRRPDGQIIEATDIGIICILKHKPADSWKDTRLGPVLMDNHFNKGAPADIPNVVVVCLPRAYFGMEVVNVTATEKMVVEDHRVKANFK
jgi:thiol-disulfide isomerase/thioredoxin